MRDVIGGPDPCWLSPISVWEAGQLVQRGRISVPGTFTAWVRTAMQRFPVSEAPLNTEVAIASLTLALPHKDPADRFLCATAVVFDLVLVTVDQHIVQSAVVPTRSS